MKEHFQDHGVRKWAGDDLIELQSESLEALQGLVEPYAPCIIKGCDVETVPGVDGSEPTYKVSGGLVALRGVDAAGNGCVKIARVEEFMSEVMPVYLSLANKQTARAYGDGSSKVIANDYIAERSVVASDDALELTRDGGKRLVDTIGITQKLDRDRGEAKDTVVGFTVAADRTELTTGSKLGVLFGLVKKWLSDLRGLAFKDKVAKGDLTDELAKKLDDKVDSVDGMGLSDNNFTDALKDKLDSVELSANNYSLPAATANTLGGVKLGAAAVQTNSVLSPSSALARTYPIQQNSAGKMVVNVPWVNTTYSDATTTYSGLMSADDKAKLNELTFIRIVAAGYLVLHLRG